MGVLVLFISVRSIWRRSAQEGYFFREDRSALGLWSHSLELVCHVPEAAKAPPPHTTAARRKHQAAWITPESGISILGLSIFS